MKSEQENSKMQLADDRNWHEAGWGYTGPALSIEYNNVYCYFPPYSLLPYCQRLQVSDRGARPELYKRSGSWRPQKLKTEREVQGEYKSGCCSTCSHIKNAYDSGKVK